MVNKLINSRIDINIKSEEGKTLLHINTGKIYCYVKITRLLIETGVDASAKDHEGKTVLDYAVKGIHFEAVELLQKGKSKTLPNATDEINTKNTRKAEVTISHIDYLTPNNNGWSPLLTAVHGGFAALLILGVTSRNS